MCSSTFIWTCISDVNAYSHSSVIVPEHFCGFIDGRNALSPSTTWNIHLKPNINIHFLKFVLFDNYWYCDYEYLRVNGNNKSSTFCGNRLPWVHDAADTSVKIILMTPWAGTKNYQLELLYYGAYVPNYKHLVIFIQPSLLTNIHRPNTEQNAFESFHFISSNRLEVVELEAIDTCNKSQVVCYDGPGFKSPVLQFTHNQSVWECLSSTFQMMCKFSRVYKVCTNIPRLHYRAIRARDDQVNVYILKFLDILRGLSFRIYGSESKGTTKYIYHHLDTFFPFKFRGMKIHIKVDIKIPYMFSEGHSCMYGGLYIVQNNSSEILSLCTSTFNSSEYLVSIDKGSVVIIHYSEYSTGRILFYARYKIPMHGDPVFLLNQTYKEDTLSITVPSSRRLFVIHSYQLRLRKIYYINISFDAYLEIQFNAHLRTSCIHVTMFYIYNFTNLGLTDRYKEIFSRVSDKETISGHRSFDRKQTIQSAAIDMCACTLVRAPVWDLFIQMHDKYDLIVNGTQRYILPVAALHVRLAEWKIKHQFWAMVHMRKPENVPVHAIWRVHVQFADIEAIEVLDDHSSSWFYTWDNLRRPSIFYITVNKVINIVLQPNTSGAHANCILRLMEIWFIRHSIHDERINKYITGQPPQQFNFSFHNKR